MTRQSLSRTMRQVYFVLFAVLAVSLAAKLGDNLPGVKGSPLEGVLKDVYEYLKDMALVFVTVVAAYLANVFQKRNKFVESLEEEWRGIVRTKSTLMAYCEKAFPTADDYIAAYARISETLDNMRIVYRNVGETDELIGLYPYAPLHDMRRALQTIDPRGAQPPSPASQQLAREAIAQCFYALRENFLEELDLQAPSHPLLISGGRRLKQPGAKRAAKAMQERQRKRQDQTPSPNPELDAMLRAAREKEKG